VHIIGCSDGLIPLQHAEGPEQVEEERRLLYVAMTRAERELHMSWALARQPGGRATRRPSRFLDSITSSTAPTDRSAVERGSGRGPGKRARGRKGPAQCRSCGKALVTPAERTIGRCRTCPATFDESFFEDLKAWRREQATERAVPAYVVFTDATLIAIAEQLPGDRDALSTIPGIGPAKLEQYGDALLAMLDARTPIDAGGRE
jgi:Superfamily II DNA helicase